MRKSNIIQLAYGAYLYPYLYTQKFRTLGTNIYQKEWDVAIILDACRIDAIHSLKDEYEFISSVGSYWSVGSTSKEWMINTFNQEYTDEVSQTAIVTGNGWAEKIFQNSPEWGKWTALNDSYWENHHISKFVARNIVSSTDFQSFVPVWDDRFSKANNRAPRAEAVTDAAITLARNNDPSRMIIHYMQPHTPYFCDFEPEEELPEINRNPLEKLKSGAKKEDIWKMYIDNLRYVLDSVSSLLQNLDAENTIITSDHGELFGELGLCGHVAGLPHPHLRKVPWIEAEATDTKTHVPNRDIYNSDKADLEQRLHDLGYL